MTKKPSATQQVLTALAEGQRLTALDALSRFGVMHLASCIRELKTKGWPIKSRLIETPNTRKHVAVYWLD